MNIFFDNQKKLRDMWWIGIFFLVLAAFTFPLILASQHFSREVTITQQAVVVILATWISQGMRRKPMSELLGYMNFTLIKNALFGLVAGALLMLVPAACLSMFGYIHWQQGSGDFSSILNTTWSLIAAAIAEEFLFRGFVFQRLRKSTGLWIAQLIIAAYFLLTHINNPGMTGNIKILASVNIFIASLMFGLAYVKTNSLIMPITFHFMANWVQGTLLGFGVSGNVQASIMKPLFHNAPVWLSGGNFGLEASIPGLVSVVLTTFILYRWRVIPKVVTPNEPATY
ncbi:type II CAAX endopeptidase family protein [Pollutibacter soli]|uniref:CPBP family intramembrane glutamic endopeptidase n=1 Tax=Pollutibacter soli TaxID=3034157 RepID=UPI0030137836